MISATRNTLPRVRGRHLGYLALVIVMFAAPYVLNQYYVGILTQILIFGLWAVSLNVLIGTSGLDSLGHAAMLGTAAYATSFFQLNAGMSYLVAGVVAVLVTMMVSLVFSLMTMRAGRVAFMMITLAQGMLVWGLAHTWVSVTDGDNGLRGGGPSGVFETYYAFYWLVGALVVVSLVLLKLVLDSSVGLRLRGVRDSQARMASLGYSVQAHRLIAFNLASLPAAVAGVLYIGHFNFISPSTVVVAAAVEVFLMVILGGAGYFLGPMLGAALLTLLRTELSVYTDRWLTVMGALLIVSVLFAREGVSALIHRAVVALRSSGAQSPSSGTSSLPVRSANPAAPNGDRPTRAAAVNPHPHTQTEVNDR